MTGIVLALGAMASAVACGGVGRPAFTPAEIAVVGLAVVRIWRKGWPSVSRLPLVGIGYPR